MAEGTKDELISAIIAFALGDLANWKPPTPQQSVGPIFPDVFRRFAEELRKLRDDLAYELRQIPEDRLRREFQDSETPAFNPLFDRHGLYGDLTIRLAKLKRHTPPDFAGGWAIREKQIDLAYWNSLASYSLAETVLLTVGRDPRTTDYKGACGTYGRTDEADEVLYFLEDLYESIANGMELDPTDENARVDAGQFLIWVEAHNVMIDARFRRMLRDRRKRLNRNAPTAPVSAPSHKEKPLHESSHKVHARILCAVARAKYGLVDKATLPKAAKAIKNDGDLQGPSFDIRVVRGLLKRGLDDYDGEK